MMFSETFYFWYFQRMMGLSGHNPIIGQERSVKNKLLRTPWRPHALWRHPPPHLNCVWTFSPGATTYRLSSTLRCVWFCFLVNFTWRNAAAGLSRNSFCSTGRCWDPPTPTHSFSLLITISVPLYECAGPTDLFYCWRTLCFFPVWGY